MPLPTPARRPHQPCAAAASPSPASSHRHPAIAGGLSCLFSSPAAAPRAATHDEPGALFYDRFDTPTMAGGGGDYSYSQPSSPFKSRDHLHHSPVSLIHSPASSPASRSASVSWLAGRERERLLSSFLRNAVGSYIDYAPVTTPPLGVTAAAGELAFELDENLLEAELSCEPYARDLLAGAQGRHRIFHDELVIKAFFEAERAHQGQVDSGPCK